MPALMWLHVTLVNILLVKVMIARFWYYFMLFEILLYTGLVSLVMLYGQWSWWSAAILVFVLLIGWRTLFAVYPFIIYKYLCDYPEERMPLSFSGYIHLLWGEIYFRFVSHFILMPTEAWLPNGKLQSNPQQIPIIFIHGLLCNRAIWFSVQTKFTQLGYHNHHSLTLEPLFSPIEAYLPKLEQAVENACQQTNHQQVIFVGHSMGGLIARLYAQHNPQRVAHIITLGTPHHGSQIACHFDKENVTQMCVGSAFLQKLNRSNLENQPVPITSIFTCHDNMNFPAMTSILPKAKNISLTGVAHQYLVIHPQVFALLWDTIQTVTRQDMV